MYSTLLGAISLLNNDTTKRTIDETADYTKLQARDDLAKVLQHIRSTDTHVSTLASALNAQNIIPRESEFGKNLAECCGEVDHINRGGNNL